MGGGISRTQIISGRILFQEHENQNFRIKTHPLPYAATEPPNSPVAPTKKTLICFLSAENQPSFFDLSALPLPFVFEYPDRGI